MHEGSTSSGQAKTYFAAIVAVGVELVRNCDMAVLRLAGLGLLISTGMMATLLGLVWLVSRVW